MRLLLDENFPADFVHHLGEHELLTIHRLGWSGVKNGELLRRAAGVCDLFLTLDRNLQFQQNIRVLPFGVVIVRSSVESDGAPAAACSRDLESRGGRRAGICAELGACGAGVMRDAARPTGERSRSAEP